MPTHTSHEPGTFAWVDLVTKDLETAKKFYGGLFGWTFEGAASHAIAQLDGRAAAAIVPVPNMPSFWNNYVAVVSADEMVKKAVANGGKLVQEPFDVMDAGRTAVVRDPAGGAIALWEPKKHIGAGVKNEPGALCWNELYSTNTDAARSFYTKTFDWDVDTSDMGPAGLYTLFQRSGQGKQGNVGGMMGMPPGLENVPSHWLPYFQVTNADEAAEKARNLGGDVIAPPMDLPNIGRFTVVRDSQGATMALFELRH